MQEPLEGSRASLERVHRILDKQGQARRWRVEIIHGTANNVRFDSAGDRVDLQLAGQSVRLNVSDGGSPISENDSLFIRARQADPSSAVIYFNESTGSKLDRYRKDTRPAHVERRSNWYRRRSCHSPNNLFAARAERTFAFPGWLLIPVYAVCVVVAATLIFLSGGILIVGLQTVRLSNLMCFIAFGR